MRLRQLGAAALAVFLMVSMVAPAAVLAQEEDNDLVQNPSIDADVTKTTHEVGWSATTYENDNGETDSLPATINESHDNPVSFEVSEVNASDFSEFPHNKDGVSAIASGEWTVDASSGGSGSTSDVTTAPDVDAVQLSATGQTSTSDTVTFTFNNFSVTSDAEKRYLQVVYDINTLDSGTDVQVRAVDADGDYKQAEINTSRSSGDDFMANSTGDGYVYQHQLGQLSTQGNGDGTFSEIQKVEVHVNSGNATVDVVGLNVEKLSEWKLGEEKVDTDDDDDLETETINEVKTSGSISVHSLASLGSTFDDATIHHVTIPMQFEATAQPEADVDFEFVDAESYPNFEYRLDLYYRLSLPDAYDLSYANARLNDEVKMPSNRYTEVRYAEGVSDTEFEDISSWSSVKSNYDTEGANVTLDSTIQPGTELAVNYDYLLTSDEKSTAESILSSAVAVGPMGGGGGGFLSMLFSIPGMIISSIVGLLGGRRLGII